MNTGEGKMVRNKYTIKIPMKVHSRNAIDKMHWSRKRKLRQDYQVYIRQQMSHFRIKKAIPEECFKIQITVCRVRMIKDHDNLVGGCKQLIDALSHEGFIWDDSSEYIGIPIISQHHLKGEEAKEGDFVLIARSSDELPTLSEVLEDQGRKKSWLAEQMACENSTITRWVQTNEIPAIKRKRIEEVLGVKIKENIS